MISASITPFIAEEDRVSFASSPCVHIISITSKTPHDKNRKSTMKMMPPILRETVLALRTFLISYITTKAMREMAIQPIGILLSWFSVNLMLSVPDSVDLRLALFYHV